MSRALLLTRSALGIAATAIALTACGGTTADPITTPATASSTEAAAGPYPAGSITEGTLPIEGALRRFLVAVPPEYDPDEPAPLLLDLHGRGGTAADQALTSRITDPAWRAGFVVVHPQAPGYPPTWPVWPELDQLPAEIDFFASLIDHLQDALAIDPDRVFVTGFSNGGGMAGRLACELGDRIAGIAPVGATNEGWQECNPGRPIPVLAFHGTADPIVPFDGERVLLPAIPEWAAWWAASNGCESEPEVFPTATGRVHHWRDCPGEATVSLVVIDGGGHTWPDRVDVAPITEQGVWRGATEIIVEFFADR